MSTAKWQKAQSELADLNKLIAEELVKKGAELTSLLTPHGPMTFKYHGATMVIDMYISIVE